MEAANALTQTFLSLVFYLFFLFSGKGMNLRVWWTVSVTCSESNLQYLATLWQIWNSFTDQTHQLQLALHNTTAITNKHLLSGCLHSLAHLFLKLHPVTTAPSPHPLPFEVSDKEMTRYCAVTVSRDISRMMINLSSTHTLQHSYSKTR